MQLLLAATRFLTGREGRSRANSLTVNGRVDITGGSSRTIAALSTINNGVMSWQGSAVYVGSGVTIDNRGEFRIETDQDLRRTGAAPHLITNTGTFTKTVGSEAENTFVDVPFANDGGMLSVAAGTLRFTQGGTYSGGTYSVAQDAVLELATGTHELSVN